jgi:hypothetical protein
MFMLLTLFWQTYYSDPVNRDKKISAQRAYAATPSAVAVVSAYISSAHGHVDVALPNNIFVVCSQTINTVTANNFTLQQYT